MIKVHIVDFSCISYITEKLNAKLHILNIFIFILLNACSSSLPFLQKKKKKKNGVLIFSYLYVYFKIWKLTFLISYDHFLSKKPT